MPTQGLLDPAAPKDGEVKKLWLKVWSGEMSLGLSHSVDRVKKALQRNARPLSRKDALIGRWLCCAVYDYLCRYPEANEVLAEEASAIRHQWKQKPRATDPLIEEQEVYLVIGYADCQYRLNEWENAARILSECAERAARVTAPGSTITTLSTLAMEEIKSRIAFSRGRLERQNGRYEDSELHFSQSIDHAYSRLGAASVELQGDSLNLANAHARVTCANALSLGLSWMLVHKGQLRAARSLIGSARILYSCTDDQVHLAFCDMLIGAIERSEAGADSSQLAHAIGILAGAKKVLDSFGHTRYGAIAAYYLATCYLQSQEYAQAERLAKEVANLRGRDSRWAAFSQIVLSRIYREQGDLDKAINTAVLAVAMVEGGPHADCKVDAIVALGEAQLRKGLRREAEQSFTKALQFSHTMANPKWTGACYLHLANTYIEGENRTEAQQYIKLWESISLQIQNGFLKSFAARLSGRLDAMDGDFLIGRNLSEVELNFDIHKENLQKFLVRKALAATDGDIRKASKLLKISRPTIYTIISRTDPLHRPQVKVP